MEMLDRLGGCQRNSASPRKAIDTEPSTNLDGVSYNPILVLGDRLKKMLRDEPMQINDAPGLAKVFIDLIVRHSDFPTRCQRPRLSLHLQVLVPSISLSSSTTLACDIANPIPPDL